MSARRWVDAGFSHLTLVQVGVDAQWSFVH
jgi:hypothetical protein